MLRCLLLLLSENVATACFPALRLRGLGLRVEVIVSPGYNPAKSSYEVTPTNFLYQVTIP